ncbi:hypothetical protein PZE02_003091 [Salmonella enterica subsp. enterica serovar Vitkin]|uniref:Morphogenetic protein n=1 Tax=Salmonella enterica subsp. enterica serovar Vitkin TaxID=2565162 RepID=A0A5I4ZVL7_SALET|nr:hypothetical protein [Salmonella enterica]EBP3979323.1 hypothetical protein [Salmonella enterica subsp. enterica]EBY0126390.1 hypothetical protein [Salmonella enterica subsp. enterica serovar Vitkin]ECC9461757.1 hypothetical protein [Salmonella enterica subsp. salamae]EIP4340909.1 hypothetical protein [Salmonella enterica subsp. enterica serovar Pomona]EAA9516289.1 hypothetical protein [Salmonella enterica]
MKERGMIFNGEMVRAIIDGRKTQTRRPIKWKQTRFTEVAERDDGSLWPWAEDCERGGDIWFTCPFGEVGDRIWVRETFSCIGNEDGHPVDANSNLCSREDAQRIYRASAIQNPGNYGLWTSPDGFDFEGSWTPSIHMPRWASRITLEITDVRVERLNNISECDAKAEGGPTECTLIGDKYFPGFRSLWKSIYGEESWAANPWVWVIEFKRVEGGAA